MKQTSILDKNATDVYTVLPNVKKGVPDDRKANIELYNEDNMTLMARYPDNYFDVAIVDPPYGIGLVKTENGNYGIRKENKGNIDQQSAWDFERPKKEYWDELFRVSKNQIVWGANYFTPYLPPSMGWIFWDKQNGTSYFSDGELAFTSFEKGLRMIRNVTDRKDRFHPSQKPVRVYGWILNHYCKKGDKVLDTHLGSGSIAIACHKYGIDLVACEIDKGYFDKAKKRLETEQAQQSLF